LAHDDVEAHRRRQKDEDKNRRIKQHLGSKSARGVGFSTGFIEIPPIAGASVRRSLTVSDEAALACWSKTTCGLSISQTCIETVAAQLTALRSVKIRWVIISMQPT
jgi:hypothetical protein